jgi:threonine/homoserine/homoserine lactone efflux protein
VTTSILQLLPSAAAVALSPFPIIAVVVVLSAPRARRNGVAFLLGWLAGLTTLTVVMVALADGAISETGESRTVAWVRVLVAVALVGLAVAKWRGRDEADAATQVPGWMASLDDLSARKAIGIGMALAGANPKNVALTAAAVAAMDQVGSDIGERILVVATYVVLASVTVGGAVIAHLVAGDRVAAPLAAAKAFMLRNNTPILVAVLLLLAVMIGSEGIDVLRG